MMLAGFGKSNFGHLFRSAASRQQDRALTGVNIGHGVPELRPFSRHMDRAR